MAPVHMKNCLYVCGLLLHHYMHSWCGECKSSRHCDWKQFHECLC